MGTEIDLMRLYPKPKNRMAERPAITDEDRRISRLFDFDYFDGDRRHGYGGYAYHPKFWRNVVLDMSHEYQLATAESVLDVGCAKGFMLRDLQRLHPHLCLAGVDVSGYALQNSHPEVSDFLIQASADALPFSDQSFDLVLSINTIHNLPYDRAGTALAEIARVSRKDSFVMVDGWKSDLEKTDLQSWVLTAQTMLHEDDWLRLFEFSGYKGDYWFWKMLDG